MALRIPLDEAIQLVGFAGRTSIHDLSRALCQKGRIVMPKVNFISGQRPIMPDEAFIRQWFQHGGKRWYHWLYKRGGWVHCPDSENPWPVRSMQWELATDRELNQNLAASSAWLTSYNPIYDLV